MEAVSPQMPDATQCSPLVASHHALRSILDNAQRMCIGNAHDFIHFTGHTSVMHRNDSSRLGRNRLGDKALVKIERIFANIHKDRHCPAQHECIGSGHKGKGGKDDFVPRAKPKNQC